MKIDLRTVRPNPFRDYQVDPLDEENGREVMASIKEHGMWGGMTARRGKKTGEYELAAGATRVWAAIALGITHAEIHVRDYSDEEMIRVYAVENLTQRGIKLTTAMAGTIASAIRYIVKAVLKNDPTFAEFYAKVGGYASLRGQILNGDGLGAESIAKFYKGVEGITKDRVREYLSNLKKSGVYTRIVKEVTEEIAQEQAGQREELERLAAEAEARKAEAEEKKRKAKEARAKAKKDKQAKAEATAADKEAEQAKAAQEEAEAKLKEQEQVRATQEAGQKAAERAAQKKVTFDFEGVSKYLKTPHQIRSFRQIIEREQIASHIPVKSQADLAALLLHYANTRNNGKLTGEFIEKYFTALLRDKKMKNLELTEEALAEIEKEDVQTRWENMAVDFIHNIALSHRNALEMIELKDKYPRLEFKVSGDLLHTVKFAQPTINKLAQRLGL